MAWNRHSADSEPNRTTGHPAVYYRCGWCRKWACSINGQEPTPCVCVRVPGKVVQK